MKSILDPSFRYVPSSRTDIAKTFARVRRELRSGEQSKGATGQGGGDVGTLRRRQPVSVR